MRSSRRSRVAVLPARGLRSRRQPRGSEAPRHGNGRRRPDCGSAPIGKRRTGAASGETRCSGTEGLGDVASSCRSSVTPMPARASTPRPRARLRATPLRPRLTDDGCRDPVVSFDLRRDPIAVVVVRPHYAADGCRGLNQASRVCVVFLEEPGGSVMMARSLIGMIRCGGCGVPRPARAVVMFPPSLRCFSASWAKRGF